MFGVHEPPVDVHKIAEQLDFLVVPYDFPDETSAVLYIHEGVKSIGVNQRHAPVRQRFSIAHELGHYLSGHEDYTERGEGEKIQVDGRFDPSDPQQRLEQEANDFAAELLMPEAMVKEEMARMESFDATILARRFDVSEQALWIRLVGLGLAPE
ncbi:MAG: ImmA/IrrE family metallo-endopeptidase [Chloroflexi bacterium]|nr:ImmA/IrrE family metallo-endopeptidase [Chloroflexota bacterium]